jgi:putative phage-type endonuclease
LIPLPTQTPPPNRGRAPNRSRFLGGTDAAVVLGVSPYATRTDLWLEKTRRAAPRVRAPIEQRRLALGHRLEPIVLEMAVHKLRELGHEVEVLAKNKRYTDPAFPFLSCEIDWELRLDGEHVNGDSKTVTSFVRSGWGDEQTDQIPLHYAAQFMHGLGITARRRTIVAALIGLEDVAIYHVDRDDETLAAMRKTMVDFWEDHVVADVPPMPQKLADVKALFPEDNGRTILATEAIAAAARELRETKMRLSMLRAKEDQLATMVAGYMGPNATLAVEGQAAFTLNSGTTTVLDEKALRRAHPDIVALFEREAPTRTMRLKNSWRG